MSMQASWAASADKPSPGISEGPLEVCTSPWLSMACKDSHVSLERGLAGLDQENTEQKWEVHDLSREQARFKTNNPKSLVGAGRNQGSERELPRLLLTMGMPHIQFFKLLKISRAVMCFCT